MSKLGRTAAIVRAAKREHWSSAFEWLGWTLLLGALPFWGVMLLWWLFAKSFEMQILVKDAQLAVYAAGLLSTTIPAIQKSRSDSPFPHPKWFLLASILVILLAALLLGSTVVTLGGSTPRVDRILCMSVVLVVISFSLGFLNELVTSIRENPDVRRMGAGEVEDLSSEVRERVNREHT